jgi:hypothetical protein
MRHALIVPLRRGLVAHASAKPRYLLPATLAASSNSRPVSVARRAGLKLNWVDETYSRFAAAQSASLKVPR